MTLSHLAKSILLGAVLLVAACHNRAPIESFQNEPIPTNATRLPADDIASAIKAAAVELKFVLVNEAAGRLTLTYSPRGHSATVDVTYTQTSYSITLVSSSNLSEADGAIDHHYNFWARNLKESIDRHLVWAGSKT